MPWSNTLRIHTTRPYQPTRRFFQYYRPFNGVSRNHAGVEGRNDHVHVVEWYHGVPILSFEVYHGVPILSFEVYRDDVVVNFEYSLIFPDFRHLSSPLL